MSVLYSYKLRSHSEHLLVEHLKGVSVIGVKLAENYKLCDSDIQIVRYIGLCHDFGKATEYFQTKLLKGKDSINANHGLISALFFYHTYKDIDARGALIGYLCIKKHHGNILDAHTEFTLTEDNINELKAQCKSLKNADTLNELNSIYACIGVTVLDFLNWCEALTVTTLKAIYLRGLKGIKGNEFSTYIKLSLYYSMLLTGDKMHLVTHNNKISKDIPLLIDKSYDVNIVGAIKQKMVDNLVLKDANIVDNSFFKMRQDISREMNLNIEKGLAEGKSIFSLHVPTGSGKTYLSFEAGFKLACSNQNFNSHIFYCLPQTSIIDQNTKVLKQVLIEKLGREPDDSELLAYHSLSELGYKLKDSSDNEYILDGFDARFCMENFQSSIVVTTFVQIFNTLFKANINKIGNRFHRLVGSVLILDELQCIEPKLFGVLESMLNFLVKNYQMKIILVSATMPLLFDNESKFELIPNKADYFKRMDRITIENHTCTGDVVKFTPIEEFKDILVEDICSNKDKSFLVVLNTVKSSKYIFNSLKGLGRPIIYLSREIYPKLRLELIDKIRTSKEKYIVVSTQVVEAGVDIDMDIVYRDFAPFDSIVQVCGRANRNNTSGVKGVVKLYKLVDDKGRNYTSYIYSATLCDTTSNILAGKPTIVEKDLFELSEVYFKSVRSCVNSKGVLKDTITALGKLDLKAMSAELNLIETKDYGYVDFIINIDEECDGILRKLNSKCSLGMLEFKNLYRRLRKYTISTREYINGEGRPKYTYFGDLRVVGRDSYSKSEGLLRSENNPEPDITLML